MGIQIYWDGSNKDMSSSSADLKREMVAFITGQDRDFVTNLRNAEVAFEDPDNPNYPRENRAKMSAKFNDFLKEELKKDLDGFLAALPDSQFGDLKKKLAGKGGRDALEGLTVGDLFDSSILNKLAGLGSFQYGRKMEGIPKFDYFGSELGDSSLKVDVTLEQKEKESGDETVLTFKFGTKSTTDKAPNAIVTYPEKDDLNAIRDLKQEHLAKHGIYNPTYSAKRATVEVDTGELSLELPENLFFRILAGNSLIRDAEIQEVEVQEDGSLKGLGEFKTPSIGDTPFVAQMIAQINENPDRPRFENVIEIDGKNYLVRLGKLNTFNLSNLVKDDIAKLVKDNERSFKKALEPVLNDPTTIAKGIVELSLKTSITSGVGQYFKTRKPLQVLVNGQMQPVPEKADDRVEFFDRLASIYGDFTIVEEAPGFARMQRILDKIKPLEELGERSKTQEKQLRELRQELEEVKEKSRQQEDSALVEEMMEKYQEEVGKRAEALKKEIKRLNKLKQEINTESRSDFELLEERVAEMKEELEELQSKGDLTEREEKRVNQIETDIAQTRKTMTELRDSRKIVEGRLKRAEGKLSNLNKNMETAMQLYEQGKFSQALNLVSTPEDTGYTSSMRAGQLAGLKGRTSPRQIASFKEVWDEGIPVLYTVKAKQFGEFDLNPFKYQRGSPKSFDKEVLKGLRTITKRINRVQREIRD